VERVSETKSWADARWVKSSEGKKLDLKCDEGGEEAKNILDLEKK
jgi:hypothetical protein